MKENEGTGEWRSSLQLPSHDVSQALTHVRHTNRTKHSLCQETWLCLPAQPKGKERMNDLIHSTLHTTRRIMNINNEDLCLRSPQLKRDVFSKLM